MKTFVVGDVHGKPDLVECLLTDAGVLDVEGNRVPGVRSIQVGDLANCVADDRDGDLECLDRAASWFDVVLVGNHEHPYFGGPAFSGFRHLPEVAERLRLLELAGVYQPAALVGETLITHAGATPDWGWESAEEAYDAIAAAWLESPNALVFSRIGQYRGGGHMLGGILWSDIREPKSGEFRQVIGHTPLDELVVSYADGDEQKDSWLLRHVDWGGKHFHRLAGIWLDEHGDYIETASYEEARAA